MDENKVIQNFLMGQLKILREKRVADWMRKKETLRLVEVLRELKFDFDPIMEYKRAIYERQEKIPKDYILELICYVKISGIKDWKFFQDSEYPVNILQERGQELLACLIMTQDICDCTMGEIVEAVMWKILERAKIGRVTGCRFFMG